MTEKTEEKKASKPGRLAQAFTKAAADFEQSKIDEIKASRKLAWTVAAGAGGMALVCGITALLAIFMRTEPEPVVLKVDNSTGYTSVMRSVRDAEDHYDEVVNKYWLGQYVKTCETYDWFTISTLYDSCKLMSYSSVAKEYEARVNAPGSPLNLLKDKGRISVQVSSIVFVGDTAQVRYTSQKVSPSGENLDNSPPQKWIATIAYEFKPKQQMTEQQRLVNPLGFSVASYRRDPEASK